MPRLPRVLHLRLPPRKAPTPRNKSWSSRMFTLFLVRQQAQPGLLRDGGMDADAVALYVRQLREEAEEEVSFLKSNGNSSPAGRKQQPQGPVAGMAMARDGVECPSPAPRIVAHSEHRKRGPAMMRRCTHCRKEFTPQELSREESRGMEAERKSLGLQGVLFRYYTCSACGYADIFVDVHPLEGESPEAWHRRREELEATIRQLHGEKVEVVVVERE